MLKLNYVTENYFVITDTFTLYTTFAISWSEPGEGCLLSHISNMEKDKKKEKKRKNGSMVRVRRRSPLTEKTNETRERTGNLRDDTDVT